MSLRRAHHDHRVLLSAGSYDDLLAKLRAVVEEQYSPGVVAGRPLPLRAGVCSCFPARARQWFGMGRELIEREPAFRAALAECDAAIAGMRICRVLEQLAAKNTPPGSARSTWSSQSCLPCRWRSRSFGSPGASSPTRVVGHSMGEVAAAYVAGALTLDDAARVICRRSRAAEAGQRQRRDGHGRPVHRRGLAALRGYERPHFGGREQQPRSTVISGDPEAVPRSARQARTSAASSAAGSRWTWPRTARRWTRFAAICWPRWPVSGRGGGVPLYSTVRRSRRGTGAELDARVLGEQPARAGAVPRDASRGCSPAGTARSSR